MAKILISYDLHNPGRDYPRISERIKQLGSNWCKPLESTWVIITHLTEVQVRDDLLNYCDQSSSIYVVNITQTASAWWCLPQQVSDWLRAN